MDPDLPSYTDVLEEHDAIYPEEFVTNDGRVEISTDSGLFRTLSKICERDLRDKTTGRSDALPPAYSRHEVNIKLNICVQIVGSRGDVQPFLALGAELVRRGHRVRIATHDTFKQFVLESGLEFYPVGGDPKELMAYMVRNPGLIPSTQSLREGDVQKKRRMIAGMLHGFWNSCIGSDPVSGQPFLADAIIANPPSFAHVHCAQALGVPVHMVFTMPWSSTRAFPHPLVRLDFKDSGIPVKIANYVSYVVVDWMTWQGLGDVINDWRSSIDLEPVPRSEGHRLVDSLNIPFTYCWSPALMPKPNDWGNNIDVCGFIFRDEPEYTPDKALQHFLERGPSPIYIGFGSIVVDDPESLTQILLDSIKETGIRAIISKGWSKLGANAPSNPDVLFLDDCPHEWLFKRVSTVIHHGGAGTTACGLRCENPTIIVPFFGDQPFWGRMVHEAGAGPEPIPYKKLNSRNLSDAIRYCTQEEIKKAAKLMAQRMKTEDGVRNAVDSFLHHLPLQSMDCEVMPSHTACWTYRKGPGTVRLSSTAAEILIQHSVIKQRQLTRHEVKPINIEHTRWDPVTAMTSSLLGTTTGVVASGAKIVTSPIDAYRNALKETNIQQDLGVQCSTSTKDKTFLKASAGSAKGIGGILGHLTRGMLVDMPLAVTEGLRVVPKLYGSEIPNHGVVSDWKSGGIVAVRNFGYGMKHGPMDLFKEPVAAARQDGIPGAVIGTGKGIVNLVTKTVSASIGLVAYPAQGLMKTIVNAANSTRKKAIQQVAHEHGQDNLRRNPESIDVGEVIRSFNLKLGRYETS